MKKIFNKNETITSNSKQIELLKKHFPNCFDKDGKFIPNKLNEIVSGEVDITNESYSLNWLGKSYAKLLANQEVTTMLKEDKEHNLKEENKDSNNIYIEGDNLEVLKHMTNAYSEKIKMIYIDPPYNTGTDFIYQDDRQFTKEELSKLANIDEEESQRILDFTNSKSNSHSAWLTFMYPRLYVARELLKEDGVIFISIDDNEQAQLKLLCDEVFGEENFVGDIIRKTKSTTGDIKNGFNIQHEVLLVYGKTINIKFKGEEKNWSNYKNPDNDPKGVWISDNPSARKGYTYQIKNPYTGKIDLPPKNAEWRFSEIRFKEFLKSGKILFKKNHKDNERGFIFKRYKNEIKEDFLKVDTLFATKNEYMNQAATKKMLDLFDIKVFDYTKPVILLKKLSQYILYKDDYILDFFSGSATTAHAVMDLNASDNGNRKFIMVNLPENIDEKKNKNAYDFCVNELNEKPVITTIGKERIRRAAKKIQEDNEKLLESEKTKDDYKDLSNIDFGFKVYKTIDAVSTNYLSNLDKLELSSQVNLLNEDLNNEDIESLLLTWKLYDGIEFNEEFKNIDFAGYNAYYISNKLYLMYKGFDNNKIKLLLEKIDNDNEFTVRKIILFANNFNSKELMEIEEAVKGYKNKKEIELEIEKRY